MDQLHVGSCFLGLVFLLVGERVGKKWLSDNGRAKQGRTVMDTPKLELWDVTLLQKIKIKGLHLTQWLGLCYIIL